MIDYTEPKGLLITLYNVPKREVKTKNGFFVWGSLDFLQYQTIDSIGDLSSKVFRVLESDSLMIETRNIVLYSRVSERLDPAKAIGWTLNSKGAYPLLVLSIISLDDFSALQKLLAEYLDVDGLSVELFRTLGEGDAAIIFRGIHYDYILQCLLRINAISKSTFSVAAVEKNRLPFERRNLGRKQDLDKFSENFAAVTNSDYPTDVRVKYILGDTEISSVDQGNRVHTAMEMIDGIYRSFISDRANRVGDLRLSKYFELGQYDIEIRLSGPMDQILDLLMEEKYGLINPKSMFYRSNVFFSKTVWQTDYEWLLKEEGNPNGAIL